MFNSFINWFKNLFSYTEQPMFEPRKDVEKFPPAQVPNYGQGGMRVTPFTRALDREGLVKPRLADRCSCGFVMSDCNIYRNTTRCRKYIEPLRQDSGSDDMLLSAAVLSGLMRNHEIQSAPDIFQGGGGKFGGAGAEDSWDVPSSASTTSTPVSPMSDNDMNATTFVATEATPDPTPSSSDYSSSSSSSSSDYSSSSSDSSSSSSSDSGGGGSSSE